MKKKVLTIIAALTIGVISFIGGFVCGTQTNTEHHLNMNTVAGFDVTESGLMLYTNDGNGYYLEK